MPKQQLMYAWKVELTNGSTERGTIGVPADDPDRAGAAVVGMLRQKFGREYEDCYVVCIGPA
ncbi:hypothetical protein [Geomonas edaphica]|uniref:hypothetical protein n=1 Tax=Geomonas edaphica TaxID=2570226 RepID=UPI0010A85462|nr:hypothetical protein [Geomonas edaphica]